MDHGDPEAGELELALVRRAGSDPERGLGPLVVNPGGPGASGVAFLRASLDRMDPELVARFDLVSFDPRGVGASGGLDCHDGFARWLAADPSPDDEAEWGSLVGAARAIAELCQARHGALLAHLGTLDVARDLERLREALGAERLSYLGFSYGSLLGATYAHLHPERVRAFVLDGAIDPSLSLSDFTLQQSAALEREFEPPRELAPVQARIERSPIPAQGRDRSAGPGDLALAVVGSLYAPSSGRSALVRALVRALDGDGTDIVALADAYLEIGADTSTSFEANLATTCLDLEAPRTLETWRAHAAAIAGAAPRFGLANWNWALPCAFWPAAPAPLPKLVGAGAPPIVVLGRTRDPVTPFAWAEALARTLESGVLLPVDGAGHTTVLRGNECADAVIRDYLIELRLPAADSDQDPPRLAACP